MNAVRVVVNSDTLETRIEGRDAPRPAETPTSAPPSIKHGSRTRTLYNTETGEFRTENEAPATGTFAPAKPSGVSVRSKSGAPKSLASASADDIVNLPSLDGETSIAAALTLGEIQPRMGGGYELVNQLPAAQSQQQQNTPQSDEKPQEQSQAPAVDMRGVVGLSPSTDAVIGAIREKAPMQMERIIDGIAKGGSIDYQDIGRELNDEAAPSKLQTAHREFLSAGQTILKNAGVQDLPGFQAWALEHHPEAANNAIRAMIEKNDLGKLASLGQKYVGEAAHKLATLIQSKGVDSKVVEGKVYVAMGSGDFRYISLDRAIREGKISLG